MSINADGSRRTLRNVRSTIERCRYRNYATIGQIDIFRLPGLSNMHVQRQPYARDNSSELSMFPTRSRNYFDRALGIINVISTITERAALNAIIIIN